MDTTTAPAWTGMLPVEDTRLAVSDTGGTGTPIVYLNGAYADSKPWHGVVTGLDGPFRHITFDERARGRSARSADHSFAACLRDLDAVLTARDVERAVLVGWSYGAFVATHWTEQHPDRVVGVVCVDGGIPYGITGEASRQRIRKLFGRMRWLLPVAARLGLAARMSAAEHAEVNIELNEIAAASAPVLERLTRPVRYVLASGGNLGSGAEEMEQARATLRPVLASNPNLQVSATVASNHSKILKRDAPAVVTAICKIVDLDNR